MKRSLAFVACVLLSGCAVDPKTIAAHNDEFKAAQDIRDGWKATNSHITDPAARAALDADADEKFARFATIHNAVSVVLGMPPLITKDDIKTGIDLYKEVTSKPAK